jgi:GcrA cell cycle regulator
MTEWTDDMLTRARELWDQGWTLNRLGREFGVSRNAIAGIARRHGFARRASPIKRFAPLQTAQAKALPRPTLPPLRSLARWTPLDDIPPLPLSRVSYSVDDPPPLDDSPQPPPRPSPSVFDPNAERLAGVRFRPPASTECCWPFGTPGTKTFRFCCEKSRPGKPYCPKHYDIAYVRRAQPDAA